MRSSTTGTWTDLGTSVKRKEELGVTLSDHVRLAESRLFPLIEETLPATDLKQLAELLAPTEPDDPVPAPAA